VTLDELAARLKRLEDISEINQLFIDYGRHLDDGNFAGYAALFATDGVVKLGPMGRATGPAEIEALMERVLTGKVGATYHVISSPVVELGGNTNESNTATASVMWTVVERTADGSPSVSMIGKHHDQLVRENGRWRFRERRGTIDIPATYRA
jgi:hypothetical protein